jgi:hypothetical protein
VQLLLEAGDLLRFARAQSIVLTADTAEKMIEEARGTYTAAGKASLRDLAQAVGFRRERLQVCERAARPLLWMHIVSLFSRALLWRRCDGACARAWHARCVRWRVIPSPAPCPASSGGIACGRSETTGCF